MTLTIPRLHVANADFVTDFLAIGGDLDMYDAGLAERQVQDLIEAGVTNVLDVRHEADDLAL